VNVRAGTNIVLDHLSVSWSGEKLVVISRTQIQSSGPISRVTVQRSLLAEPLAAIPVGMNISGLPYHWEGSTPPGWTDMSDMSIHHNLLASIDHRNPNVAALGVEVVNNVVYNWKLGAGKGILGARADWVNNYLKPGPMFQSWRYELGYKCENALKLTTNTPSLYFSGNVGPRNSDPTADAWRGDSRMLGCYNDPDGTALDLAWKRDSRLPQPRYPVSVQPADAAYADVLVDVGANRGLRCDGTWQSRPDAVDQRILDDVRSGGGPSRSPVTESDAGGFPDLATGPSCADGDSDGLPDEYETRYGLDANTYDGSRDSDGDGYTNLEEFVNGSNPV
jgi:hypothetical protein